ncbi:acetyl-CoA carboxylase biotin carboxylase subunit family protein [Kitasatospora sp. NPDC093550]|uniref:ATP-grasp domain-containing protein n=1 Tax=Kitasatospora sp. NPDC093550 TaxID=3364089 RepID=UPI00382EBAEB
MPPSQKTDILLVGRYLKAVEALQERGRRVVNVVTPADLERLRHVPRHDLVVVADAGNAEDVLAGLAREGMDPRDFAAVHSMREFTLVCASLLAHVGGGAGVPVQTAVALRDKAVQKHLVRRAGLPAARCRVVDRPEDLLRDGRPGPEFPLVVKPLAGAGTRDTHLVAAPDELPDLASRLGHGPWLVEEFVAGRELHLDGIVRDGRISFLAVSRYLRNVISIKEGAAVGSVALHPSANRALYDRARSLASDALDALGLRDGIFHLEAFEQPDRLVFSECAGRIGGGVIRECLAAAAGVDLLEEWAQVVLGLPATGSSWAQESYGWINLATPSGPLVRLPGREELLARPGCVAAGVDHDAARGPLPPSSQSSNLRLGWALVAGPDEQTVAQRLGEVSAWFRAACTDQAVVAA